MYKRHNIWDEDKWDIHSSGSSGYAGPSSENKGAGYAGHSSKDSQQDYHKNEIYGSNKEDEFKPKEDYRSRDEKDEDKKKEDEQNEKTIVDVVEQEEKYKKNEEEEQNQFQTISKDIQQSNIDNDSLNNKNNKETKKKNNKSIEEAIKVAIKEEKEIVHVD